MLKLGKLTDYAIVLLTYVAHHAGSEPLTARELSDRARVPLPTVSKLLKQLGKANLLLSTRGAHGGYMLARSAKDVSIADVIVAIEGPIALTECSTTSPDQCGLEEGCPVRSNWVRINHAVVSSLRALTLAEMTPPPSMRSSGLVQITANRTAEAHAAARGHS